MLLLISMTQKNNYSLSKHFDKLVNRKVNECGIRQICHETSNQCDQLHYILYAMNESSIDTLKWLVCGGDSLSISEMALLQQHKQKTLSSHVHWWKQKLYSHLQLTQVLWRSNQFLSRAISPRSFLCNSFPVL